MTSVRLPWSEVDAVSVTDQCTDCFVVSSVGSVFMVAVAECERSNASPDDREIIEVASSPSMASSASEGDDVLSDGSEQLHEPSY